MAGNHFFTEFPVGDRLNREVLGEYMVRWISGIDASQLDIKEARNKISIGDVFSISETSGEKLDYVTVDREIGPIFGYQYDIPDESGRIWRTEVVISNNDGERMLNLRVSCVKGDFSAEIATPRRPVLLKQLLEDAIGGKDRDLLVSDSPHFISESELSKARRIILGVSSISLPIVYVSSLSSNDLPLDANQLAFELGGLAHVVVEPSRSFSFLLKDQTEGRNPYAGAIGIGFPGRPIEIRVLPSSNTRVQFSSVINLVRETFVGRTSVKGAEWSELQQAAYQNARSRLAEALRSGNAESSVGEWIESFEGEIREKDDTIESLRSENAKLRAKLAAGMSESSIAQSIALLRGVVGELYEGEILDRLRNAIASASMNGFALHDRDRAVMDALLPLLKVSGYSGVLLDQIKAASDAKRTDSVLRQVLIPLGFTRSELGSHIKFTPPKGVLAIENISIAKTPSDYRSGDNAVRDTRKALGLHFAAED